MTDRMRRVNESVRAVVAEAIGGLEDPRHRDRHRHRRRRSRRTCTTHASTSRCSASEASGGRRSTALESARGVAPGPLARELRMKRTPQLDLRIRSVGRARRAHDEADRRARPETAPMTQTEQKASTDFDAVVDALARNDRFLVVTHENPDGDALGSMLGATLGLRALGKDVAHVPRRRRPPAGRVRLHAARRGAARAAGRRSGSACCSRVDCANERRIGPDAGAARARRARRRRRPPPRQHALRRRSTSSSPTPPRPPRSCATCSARSACELTPEIAEALYIGLVTDTGRFQYANTTPKALRLAAELVEAGADVHGVFQQRLRDGAVRQAEAARARARARAGLRGRAARRLVPLRARLRRGRRRGAVLRGDHRLPAPERGRQLVALIREPPTRPGGPTHRISLRSSSDEIDVSAIARQVGRRRPRQAAGFSSERLDRGDRRVHPPRVRRRDRRPGSSMPPRAASPVGIVLVDKPAGPSSFALVAELRRRTGARTGHTGTLDPFATGLLVLLSGSATRLAPCFVGLDKRYLTDVDLTATTTTGDPEGEVVERHEPPAGGARRAARRAPRRGRAADPRRLGGEDRRRARLPARAARGGGRDAPAPLAGLRARRHRVRRATVTLGLHVSSGTYVRSIARRSAATARRCGAPRSGRSGSRRPTRSGCCRCRRRSRGCRREAVARVPTGRSARRCSRSRRGRAVKVARTPAELERRPRAVAIGTFDGVHLGHRAVVRRRRGRAAPTVVTFHPHPREVLGYQVELLATLERRLELLGELGVEEALVSSSRPRWRRWRRRSSRRRTSRAIGAEIVVAGEGSASATAGAATSTCRAARGRTPARRRSSRRLVDADPPADRRRRRARRGRAARAAGRGRGDRRLGRRPRRHARLSDGEPPHRALAARARASASTRAPRSATARRSRSASTRTTAATSGGSRRSCSTSRATSTASASSSSSGSGCATRPRSRARRSWSRRSRATSRRRARRRGPRTSRR